MEDSSQMNQSALQDLIGGGSAPSLVPESLVTTLTVGFIVLNVLGILFMIFYVANMIRKWRVDTATLKMQKDIAEIKDALIQQGRATTAPSTTTPSEPVSPAQSNRVIAAEPTITPNDQA